MQFKREGRAKLGKLCVQRELKNVFETKRMVSSDGIRNV